MDANCNRERESIWEEKSFYTENNIVALNCSRKKENIASFATFVRKEKKNGTTIYNIKNFFFYRQLILNGIIRL